MKLIAKNIHSDSWSKRWSVVDENGEQRATIELYKCVPTKHIVNVISMNTMLPFRHNVFENFLDALAFARNVIDNEPEPTVESLEAGITYLKTSRYRDEMSDDYAYSNGKYDGWTSKISLIEKKLTALKSALV